MRELDYVKYCKQCSKIYDFDGIETKCTCEGPLYNGFVNESSEIEKDKVVSANIIYRNNDNEEIQWPYSIRFKADQVDMFYGWDGYWNDFFEQEVEARKDDFKEYVKVENLVIDNPNC